MTDAFRSIDDLSSAALDALGHEVASGLEMRRGIAMQATTFRFDPEAERRFELLLAVLRRDWLSAPLLLRGPA